MFARGAGLVVLAFTLAGVAACASNRRVNLSNSAHNLEYNAAVLARDTGAEAMRGSAQPASAQPASGQPADEPRAADSRYAHDYTRDALALAHSARDLRVAVDERAGGGAVQAAFDRVSRSYHAVRDEVAHSDSPAARRDFGPVTDSYRAVEHELGVHPQRDAYRPPA